MSDKKSKIIYADFTNKATGRKTAYDVETLSDIAEELHLPKLEDAYATGNNIALMKAGTDHDEFIVEIFPYDFADYKGMAGPIDDKGFRIRVTLTNPDINARGIDPEGPFHFEVLFQEIEQDLFRQNGFFRPLDTNGGMIYPKLANETIRALVRRLVEYKPKMPSFGPQ